MALTKIGIDAIEGAIGTAQLEDNAVTTGKIAAGAVGTTDLADTSVTVDKVANTAVTTDKLANTAVTVAKLADTLDLSSKTVTLAPTTTGLGMSITSLAYPGDDTAVDTSSPGTVTIIGTGFEAGTLVYVDSVSNANSASSVVISGTTQITFTPPAKAAATYNVWLVGPTGKIAILANGIQYSGTPSWSGQSTSLESTTEVNIQLAASGDTPLVYSLVSGTLPTGVTLSSTGLISGTATGLESDTTFTNIVVKAQDPQNQDASITLSLSITVQHQISRSLRFNSADSAYLNRTFSSVGNRKRWTLSCWFKKTYITDGYWDWLFGTSVNSGLNINYDPVFAFSQLSFYDDNGAVNVRYAGSLRDTSAWYHIVLSFDSANLTSSERANAYINGVKLAKDGIDTVPLDYESSFNNNISHAIGRWNREGGSGRYLNGYLAEINFIDGQALTPASFGEINSTTGVWVPISYAGAYGTNGFYLNFSDNSDVTASTLGKDYSGNNNNWTPSGFSVTSDSDSVVDSPTAYGVDTGVGGEVRGNYCTWNPLDNGMERDTPGPLTFSNGNLVAYTTEGLDAVRGTIWIPTNLGGKYYFEITSNGDIFGFGLATEFDTKSNGAGGQPAGAGTALAPNIRVNGDLRYNNVVTGGWAPTFASGDTLGVAVDCDTGSVYFSKNGAWLNGAGGTTTFANAANASASGLEDYVSVYAGFNDSTGATLNAGQRPFAYPAPTGYKCLTVQNLPEPAIVNPGEYFNAVTYTGNESTQTIEVGFNPDIVLVKRRDGSSHSVIQDSVRGYVASTKLSTAAANAENDGGSNVTDPVWGYISGTTSTGFIANVGTSGDQVNNGSTPYVAYAWDAGTSTVTNNAGSIESQVRANTTAGVSVVTYTTQSSGAATVGHGLGVAPSLILVKPRNTTFQWDVYHSGIGKDAYLVLNSDAGQATGATTVWNSVAPTSTVFSLGTAWASAAPGALTVAYCFAEVDGFSKFGSYTGNGATDGPFIYTGFRPEVFMVKRTDSTGDWWVYDSARNPFNITNYGWRMNSSLAEVSDVKTYIVSNGLKYYADTGAPNINGATYVYMAFAQSPFKYAVAR
jgi:hypothetical protein